MAKLFNGSRLSNVKKADEGFELSPDTLLLYVG
jgi:hypothetical protein